MVSFLPRSLKTFGSNNLPVFSTISLDNDWPVFFVGTSSNVNFTTDSVLFECPPTETWLSNGNTSF